MRHVAEVSPLLAADLSGSVHLQVCVVVTSGACVDSGQTAGSAAVGRQQAIVGCIMPLTAFGKCWLKYSLTTCSAFPASLKPTSCNNCSLGLHICTFLLPVMRLTGRANARLAF